MTCAAAEFESFIAWRWRQGKQREPLAEQFIMTAGLAGETGEVCELLKKAVRSDTPVDRRKLCLELGDVIHYATRIALAHGLTLPQIMSANRLKLLRRQALGKNEAAELAGAGFVIDGLPAPAEVAS